MTTGPKLPLEVIVKRLDLRSPQAQGQWFVRNRQADIQLSAFLDY